jgi:hypothetical protein
MYRLEMKGNPVDRQHKFRDYIALMSPTLVIMNGTGKPMYVCMYVCVRTRVITYAGTYIQIYVHELCVYIYVYMYMYT